MKRWVYVLFIVLIYTTSSASAQSELNKYSYVLVPQQFEFQRGTDQFQLNSLTRHLFRKAGFNPLYQEELKNLPRCEGLTADVISIGNMFFTRLKVVLKDCNNTVVFESAEGSSKEKDLKKSYHDALKNAFLSIDALGVNQKSLDILRNESILVADNPKVEKTIKEEKKPEIVSEMASTEISGIAYSNQGISFLLKQEGANFILFRQASSNSKILEEVGTLVPSSRDGIYLFNTKGKSTLANFDANKNLIIDAVDASGNVVQQVYKIEK